MADYGLIHYQPLTGPVWREPVAAALAWLPRGEAARPLERRIPSEFVYPPFYELYQPSGLQWLPSGRWPIYPEFRKLGDFQQPPFDALYKPEQLGWMSPAYYVGRTSPRGVPDATVFPIQFAAPTFDPQHLEWIPKGTPPSTLAEIRKLGDFVQPAFDALYKPEGLQWLFEGQLSVRGIPYALQSSWVIDPSPVITVAFDPQFFPFQATDIVLAKVLQTAIQSVYATPPLPPGPDVIPPAPSVLPIQQGGYAGFRGAKLEWREWETLKKKRKEVERKSPEVARIIEGIAQENIDLAPALKALSQELDNENLRQAKIYRELVKLEIERNRFTAQLAEDDDEESITLLLNG